VEPGIIGGMEIDLAGEPAASGRMADLYVAHLPAAIRLARVLTGSVDDAEDLAQEAFIRAVGRFADLRNREMFPVYLRRAVINASKMRARRRIVAGRHEPLVWSRREPATLSPEIEERDRLSRALMTLPERQRAALALRFYCDLSEAETAEILGCRRGTVKSLVSRGVEAMRTALGGTS